MLHSQCYCANILILLVGTESHRPSFFSAILTDLRTKYSYIADVEVTYFIEAPFYSVKCMEHMKMSLQKGARTGQSGC